MKPNPQEELILSYLRDGQWHCGLEWVDMVKDDRARITRLNRYYMKERGYEIEGKICEGFGHNHKGNFFMRRAVKIDHIADTDKMVPKDYEKAFSDYWLGLPA